MDRQAGDSYDGPEINLEYCSAVAVAGLLSFWQAILGQCWRNILWLLVCGSYAVIAIIQLVANFLDSCSHLRVAAKS